MSSFFPIAMINNSHFLFECNALPGLIYSEMSICVNNLFPIKKTHIIKSDLER
jgi:ribosomal protein S3AE